MKLAERPVVPTIIVGLKNPKPKVLGYLRWTLFPPQGGEPGIKSLYRFKEAFGELSEEDRIWFFFQADKELSAGETY